MLSLSTTREAMAMEQTLRQHSVGRDLRHIILFHPYALFLTEAVASARSFLGKTYVF